MLNRCIGCYYYKNKENVCTLGSPIFIDDNCIDYQDSEFVEQIRIEAIDDFIHECDKYCEFYSGKNKSITREDILKIAEQLKE